MLEPNKRYTAKDILVVAEVPTNEKDFWSKDITIGGLGVKGKDHLIRVQKVEFVLVKVGNKEYKAKVKMEK